MAKRHQPKRNDSIVKKSRSPTPRAVLARIEDLEKECDYYRKAIYALLPKKKQRLTKKQLREMKEQAVPFEKVIEQIESEIGVNHDRDDVLAKLRRVEQERDAYLKAVYALTRKEFTFTEEELRELEKSGVALDQVIADIEELQGT